MSVLAASFLPRVAVKFLGQQAVFGSVQHPGTRCRCRAAPPCAPEPKVAAHLLPEVDERRRTRRKRRPRKEQPQAGWPAATVGVEL